MFQAILDALAKRGSDIHTLQIEGVTHAAVPEGIKLERLDLEQHLPTPKAIRRTVNANDVRGLIDYVNKFMDGRTQFYATNPASPSITARMDDHLPEEPSHIEHTCVYACPRTHEWLTWIGKNGASNAMEQKQFGEFLEVNSRDVTRPVAAEMLKLATNFRSITVTEFGSVTRASNGNVQINYVEKEQAGEVQLPETFDIAIPVFEGIALRYPLTARLRYRTPSGSQEKKVLTLWYELDRPDVVLRAAHDDLLKEITDKTGIAVFRAL